MTFSINAGISPRIVGGVESEEAAWPFMSALMFKNAGLTTTADTTYRAFFMQGTPTDDFSGELVDCGKAFEACVDAVDKICLIERGETLFTEKVNNCRLGGGTAAIIYNNVPGFFLGQADASSPAVSISQENGVALLGNNLNENITFGFLDDVPTFSFCGGSYIGNKKVITAAHCVEDVSNPASIVLNIGGHNLETDQENIINVTDIFIHRNYNTETLSNDIAILQLASEPVNVTAIEIADETILKQAISSNSEVTTIGRGSQKKLELFEDSVPELPDPNLFEVNLSLVSNETCNTKMGNIIADDMICAGNLSGGVGSCKGDSGGPLVLQVSDKTYLVGLTSWGFGCALADFYGVYNRPTYFNDAITILTDDRSQSTFISNTPKSDSGSLNPFFIFFFIKLFLIRLLFKNYSNSRTH